MNRNKSSFYKICMVLNASLGSLYVGFSITYFNTAYYQIYYTLFGRNESNLYGEWSLQLSIINFLLTLAASIGALISAWLQQIFGLKYSLIVTDLIGLFGFLTHQFLNIPALMFARVLIGLAAGLNSALVPQYIKQFSNIKNNGSMGALYQSTLNFGSLMAFFFSYGFTNAYIDYTLLIVMFAIPSIICLIRSSLIYSIFKDDLPKHFMKIRKMNYQLNQVMETEYDSKLMSLIHQQVEDRDDYTFRDMFTTSIRKRLIIGCGLSMLQQFSGIQFLIFYSTNLYYNLFQQVIALDHFTIIIGLTNFIVSLFAIYLLNKLGRRPLLLYGTFIITVILILISFKLLQLLIGSFAQVILIYLYLVVFQLSLGSVVWVYIADILPQKGVSIAVFMNWLTSSIVVGVFSNSYIYLISPFIYLSSCVLGTIFIYLWVPEVKGKSECVLDQLFL